MTLRVAILFLFVAFCCVPAYGQQEIFPYIAEVTQEQVNVRAGQSINFEKLCQLAKGQKILVVDKSYSWYKIQLPPEASSFIVDRYVLLIDQNVGEITANRVNIRAAARSQAVILGQVNEGEKVYIKEKRNEWFQIYPVKDSFGWVSEEYLSFHSNDLDSFREILDSANREMKEPEKEKIDVAPSQKDVEQPVLEKQPDPIQEKVSIEGVMEPHALDGVDAVHYKCILDDQSVYYLKDWQDLLKEFEGFKVKIEGQIDHEIQRETQHPVISVLKIQLVL